MEEEKKGFSFAQIATAVLAVSAAMYYGFSKLSDDMKSTIKETLGNFGESLFDGIVKLFDWSKLTFDEIVYQQSAVVYLFPKHPLLKIFHT